MKAVINIIVLIALLILAYFYIGNNDSAQAKAIKKTGSSNTSLSQSQQKTIQEPPEKKPQKTKKPEGYSSIFINFKGDNSRSDDDSSLSYLIAYREWRYFENCYTDVVDIHNEDDPLETLADRFKSSARESQDEATALQKRYYSLHFEECKRLIEDESDDYYAIMSKLQQRFESIEPETEQEHDLSHALSMAKQLERFKFAYSKASRGRLSSVSDEAKLIEQQIKLLSEDVGSIYESNEELSEEQINQIKQLTDQIDELRKLENRTRVVNQDEIDHASKNLDGYVNSIDDFLVNNQSPDAFLVLAKAIYQVEYFSKESTLLMQLKADLGIYDAYFIALLNQVVIPMVACSMGYPCDANSELVVSHCLGLKDAMFIQACDSRLQDFYYNYFIGPNQKADVSLYFNYLKQRYAL